MINILKPALAAAALAAVSAATPVAAADYDGPPTWRHIERDQRQVHRDAAHVREERAELNQAWRKYWWARWHGNYWGARRAAHEIREERGDLYNARHRYFRDRRDLAEDRYERWEHRHGW